MPRPLPAVFRWITGLRRVAPDEMLRTFNCGIGMVLVVPREAVAAVKTAIADAGEECFEIGKAVARAAPDAPQVTFSTKGATVEAILSSPRAKRRSEGFAAAAAAEGK